MNPQRNLPLLWLTVSVGRTSSEHRHALHFYDVAQHPLNRSTYLLNMNTILCVCDELIKLNPWSHLNPKKKINVLSFPLSMRDFTSFFFPRYMYNNFTWRRLMTWTKNKILEGMIKLPTTNQKKKKIKICVQVEVIFVYKIIKKLTPSFTHVNEVTQKKSQNKKKLLLRHQKISAEWRW